MIYPTTATEAYEQTKQAALDAIAELQAAIENMDESQAKSPRSWGHAGSMEYIASQLDDIVKFASR